MIIHSCWATTTLGTSLASLTPIREPISLGCFQSHNHCKLQSRSFVRAKLRFVQPACKSLTDTRLIVDTAHITGPLRFATNSFSNAPFALGTLAPETQLVRALFLQIGNSALLIDCLLCVVLLRWPCALLCSARDCKQWAPHVIRSGDTFFMYYCAGGNDRTRYQINLATSKDLWCDSACILRFRQLLLFVLLVVANLRIACFLCLSCRSWQRHGTLFTGGIDGRVSSIPSMRNSQCWNLCLLYQLSSNTLFNCCIQFASRNQEPAISNHTCWRCVAGVAWQDPMVMELPPGFGSKYIIYYCGPCSSTLRSWKQSFACHENTAAFSSLLS